MPKGTVKWFSAKKGYGFIADPERPADVFVHYSAIKTAGFRALEPGDVVEYEIDESQKGSRARDVVRL